MHKVRIHATKSAIKKVKEVVSKTKIVISTVAPVPTKKDKDEILEKDKKQSLNVTPILEVTPVTKASDITSLIKSSDSEEPEQEEETSAQKSLEPLVRDAAKKTESDSPKEERTYEARVYEAPKSQNYSPNTSANYKSAQRNSSQNTQYRVGIESERDRTTSLSRLQPDWEEKENSRLQNGRPPAPDNRTHYEPRQYTTPNEKINASHKRRRQPWE